MSERRRAAIHAGFTFVVTACTVAGAVKADDVVGKALFLVMAAGAAVLTGTSLLAFWIAGKP